jgi:O-antigen ligase
MVETGIIGLIIVIFMFQQMFALAYRLFKRAEDPLYKGLGLGLFVAFCSCVVANCFGDRWTYLEITGPLWVLVGTAARAIGLIESEPITELTTVDTAVHVNPYIAYR